MSCLTRSRQENCGSSSSPGPREGEGEVARDSSSYRERGICPGTRICKVILFCTWTCILRTSRTTFRRASTRRHLFVPRTRPSPPPDDDVRKRSVCYRKHEPAIGLSFHGSATCLRHRSHQTFRSSLAIVNDQRIWTEDPETLAPAPGPYGHAVAMFTHTATLVMMTATALFTAVSE